MKRGKLLADGVSNGGGNVATSTRCLRPGASCFQSGVPFGGPALAGGGGGRKPSGGPASLNVPSFSAAK